MLSRPESDVWMKEAIWKTDISLGKLLLVFFQASLSAHFSKLVG